MQGPKMGTSFRKARQMMLQLTTIPRSPLVEASIVGLHTLRRPCKSDQGLTGKAVTCNFRYLDDGGLEVYGPVVFGYLAF